MTRRPSAPDSALTVRTVAALTILAGYIVLRLPSLTSPWEAAATWVGACFCGGIAISSLEELGLRRYFRAQRIESIRDAVTETFAPVREWPDATELAIAEARHAAMVPIIDRGEVVEPKLFTHEFQPLTPPHGTLIGSIAANLEPPVTELFDGEKFVEIGYVGRHRLADAQLNRKRTGHLFGTL